MRGGSLWYAAAFVAAAGIMYYSSGKPQTVAPRVPAGWAPAAVSAEYQANLRVYVRRVALQNRDFADVSAPDANTILLRMKVPWSTISQTEKARTLKGISDSLIDIRTDNGIPFDPQRYPGYIPTVRVEDGRGRLLARQRLLDTEFYDPAAPRARPRVVRYKGTVWEPVKEGT
ncbi:MAG TPA: hypothetical protein VGN26_20755 [Armatimonadota bacterium]